MGKNGARGGVEAAEGMEAQRRYISAMATRRYVSREGDTCGRCGEPFNDSDTKAGNLCNLCALEGDATTEIKGERHGRRKRTVRPTDLGRGSGED